MRLVARARCQQLAISQRSTCPAPQTVRLSSWGRQRHLCLHRNQRCRRRHTSPAAGYQGNCRQAAGGARGCDYWPAATCPLLSAGPQHSGARPRQMRPRSAPGPKPCGAGGDASEQQPEAAQVAVIDDWGDWGAPDAGERQQVSEDTSADVWFEYEDDFPLDSVVQNFLAVILTTVLALAVALILVKLAAVVWALAAAAVRYSVVALILVALTIFLG